MAMTPARHAIARLLVAGSIALSAPTALSTPTRVDLRSGQTSMRNQGSRTTCITFAALAALEAAYKRAGYGELDLSEQFLNHVGKVFWLHPYWDDIARRGRDGSESQVGAFGGGGGSGYVAHLASGLRVPLDVLLPYRSTEYTATDHPHLANAWDSPFWNMQQRMNDFNLDARFLPRVATSAAQYYSVRTFTKLADPRSASEIETVLASGKEVVWDFAVANTAAPLWRACTPDQPGCPGGGHSMIIVGYDRTAADRSLHYFIAKNSWGTAGARADGFTYISYDYLQYGYSGAYIDTVNPPALWPQLANIGRWSLNFDGWKGQLDAYHIPGVAQAQLALYGVTTPDRRIGTFYDAAGQSFHVNGSMTDNRMYFNIDGARPTRLWDETGGRQFSYLRVRTPAYGEVMAGTHRDADGSIYGGYARVGGLLPGGTTTPRPLARNSYLAANWDVHFEGKRGVMRLTRADDSFLTAGELRNYQGLVGTFTRNGATTSSAAQVLVARANPNVVVVRLPTELPSSSLGGQLSGRHLNHEAGVVAGGGTDRTGYMFGFFMIRQ